MDVEKIYKLSRAEQITNVGAEVARALRFLAKGDKEKASRFAAKANEFMDVVSQDPKNKVASREFALMMFEFNDFMNGCEFLDSTPERIQWNFDQYLYSCGMSHRQ